MGHRGGFSSRPVVKGWSSPHSIAGRPIVCDRGLSTDSDVQHLREVYGECGWAWTPAFESALEIVLWTRRRESNGKAVPRVLRWVRANRGRAVTHEYIARETGLARETVTRSIKELLERGELRRERFRTGTVYYWTGEQV